MLFWQLINNNSTIHLKHKLEHKMLVNRTINNLLSKNVTKSIGNCLSGNLIYESITYGNNITTKP